MKKILLFLIGLFYGLQCFAQDSDPNLFRTWYLYEVLSDDFSSVYVVAEIDPRIYPSITILETLEFNGVGACNTFSGTYIHLGNTLESNDLTSTTTDCGIQIHNSFENSFFWFMRYFWYEITPDGNGLYLRLDNPIGGYAILKDYPLSLNENNFNNEITLFPNPVSDQLFISSENTQIENVRIYSISGKQVLEFSNVKNSIDVSSLSEGIYFLEINTSEGKSIQKFIKK